MTLKELVRQHRIYAALAQTVHLCYGFLSCRAIHLAIST
jgi:hypothetical protein